MSRRLVPIAIAVVVVAAASGLYWWFSRPDPVPATPPSSTPAIGSCWTVNGIEAAGLLPWSGQPVDCAGAHTVEVFHTGQVDHALVRTQRTAKGRDRQINTLLMTAEARAGCTARVTAFLGGSPRGARITVLPDFIRPADDGFYACAVAETGDPTGATVLPRQGSLRGVLAGKTLAIDCVGTVGDALAYVPCGEAHTSEYVGLYTVTPAGAPYDGEQLRTAVTTGCQALVNAFLGLSPTAVRPDLSTAFVGPSTSTTWLGSDQTFACYARASHETRGSVKGLGTRALPY